MKRSVPMTMIVLLGAMLFSAAQATDLGSEPKRKPVFGIVTVAVDQVARLHAYNASRRVQKVELLFTDENNRLLADPIVKEVEPGTTATLEYDPAAQDPLPGDVLLPLDAQMIRARINVAKTKITDTMIASLEIVDKESKHTVLYIAPRPLIEH